MATAETITLADSVREYLQFLEEEKYSGLSYEARMSLKREKLAAMRRALSSDTYSVPE